MAQRTVGTVDSQGGLRWSTSSGNVAARRVPPPTTGRWWPCRCRCPSGCWISVRMVCCWLARPLCASARQCGSFPGWPGGGWRSNSASVTRPAGGARRLAVASSAGAFRRSTRRPGKSSARYSPRAHLAPPANRLPGLHRADQRPRPLAASGASVLLGGRDRLGRTKRPGSHRHRDVLNPKGRTPCRAFAGLLAVSRLPSFRAGSSLPWQPPGRPRRDRSGGHEGGPPPSRLPSRSSRRRAASRRRWTGLPSRSSTERVASRRRWTGLPSRSSPRRAASRRGAKAGVPTGIRTRVSALKGPRPNPWTMGTFLVCARRRRWRDTGKHKIVPHLGGPRHTLTSRRSAGPGPGRSGASRRA